MQAGPERALMQMWRAAIAAALPRACLAGHWPTAPEGRLVLIACGKAALPMAAEAVRHYGDNLAGIVIFPGDGQSEPRAPAPGLRLCPASHPVPDERSESAGRAAVSLYVLALSSYVAVEAGERREPPWALLLVIPLAFTQPYYMGFTNYFLTLPALLFALRSQGQLLEGRSGRAGRLDGRLVEQFAARLHGA